MPTSKKQLKSNRQNAQKSTGPASDQGKLVASRNAITHGLHAADIVIDSPHLKEDHKKYCQLVQSLVNELKPAGILQEHLVHKIANCLWRYRRAINAETAAVNSQLSPSSLALIPGTLFCDQLMQPHKSRELANRIHSNSIPDGDFSRTLLRYEWRLERELSRSYLLLHHLQYVQASNSLQNLTTESELLQSEPSSPEPHEPFTDSETLPQSGAVECPYSTDVGVEHVQPDQGKQGRLPPTKEIATPR